MATALRFTVLVTCSTALATKSFRHKPTKPARRGEKRKTMVTTHIGNLFPHLSHTHNHDFGRYCRGHTVGRGSQTWTNYSGYEVKVDGYHLRMSIQIVNMSGITAWMLTDCICDTRITRAVISSFESHQPSKSDQIDPNSVCLIGYCYHTT